MTSAIEYSADQLENSQLTGAVRALVSGAARTNCVKRVPTNSLMETPRGD